jgi:hypothetical protein
VDSFSKMIDKDKWGVLEGGFMGKLQDLPVRLVGK